MRQGFVACLLVSLAVSSASAEQVVVFKKDGRYGDRMITVESIETGADGRLLLHAGGELFVVERSEVDWTRSQEATLRHQAEQRELAAKKAIEDEARRSAFERAQAQREPLTLVEASRRYGVARPAVTVASGSASRAPEPARAGGTGEGEAPQAAPARVPETAGVLRARSRVAQIQEQQKKLGEEIAALKTDTNPDPVAAGIRASQIERKERQLEALGKRLEVANTALQEAEEAAGEEARQAEAAAAEGG